MSFIEYSEYTKIQKRYVMIPLLSICTIKLPLLFMRILFLSKHHFGIITISSYSFCCFTLYFYFSTSVLKKASKTTSYYQVYFYWISLGDSAFKATSLCKRKINHHVTHPFMTFDHLLMCYQPYTKPLAIVSVFTKYLRTETIEYISALEALQHSVWKQARNRNTEMNVF